MSLGAFCPPIQKYGLSAVYFCVGLSISGVFLSGSAWPLMIFAGAFCVSRCVVISAVLTRKRFSAVREAFIGKGDMYV